MKAATKSIPRRAHRSREADGIRGLRARDAVTFAHERYLGQQLPLSLAPYRLQAADRWWREACAAASPDVHRKRPA